MTFPKPGIWCVIGCSTAGWVSDISGGDTWDSGLPGKVSTLGVLPRLVMLPAGLTVVPTRSSCIKISVLLKSGTLPWDDLLDDVRELEFSIPFKLGWFDANPFSEPPLGLLCSGVVDPLGVWLPGLPPRMNVTSASWLLSAKKDYCWTLLMFEIFKPHSDVWPPIK